MERQATPSLSYGRVARRTALALAAACGIAPALAQGTSGAPVRIGSVLSVTGGLASVGLPEREGMLVAQKVINARGGINGRPLEIVQEDDASSPDSAVSKINALVFTHKVKGIIGPSGIAQTVAVGGITQKANVHLTPAQELNARGLLAYARDHQLKRLYRPARSYLLLINNEGRGRRGFSRLADL